ncbi:G-type lectin S-receptor-like serine/threonine-protein kinase At2g19130 [Corylus avellana]|uniref:G-type lectin S-receptor-like serine/threonine-protein kinase At2g19130 n=1 Tax=Corylus avellana TaxID=13451 RepID=UPI00286B669E|nr:G-type lectin S-receptor-like serine/threonine-protein kinase At2g19130 [Corylus avellana]
MAARCKVGIEKVTGKPQQLISWKNSQDPSPGVFSLGLDPNGSHQNFLEWNRSQIYWSSGLWNATSLSSLSERSFIINYTLVSSKNESERYFTYSLRNPSTLSRYRVDQAGQMRELVWLSALSIWSIFWSAPTNLSDVYALCGAFGMVQCPENFSNPCECLKGFEPFSMNYTRLNDWSGGCVRKSLLQCENNRYANGKKDWFMQVSNMRLPVYSKVYNLALNASRCELACIENCSCAAYAYNRSGCMISEGALLNSLQLPYGSEIGQDIYLRFATDEYPDPSTKDQTRQSCSSNNLLLFDFDTELHTINDGMNTENNTKKREKKDAELPLFSYESVLAGTNNFSAVNKLGEGGVLNLSTSFGVLLLEIVSGRKNTDFSNSDSLNLLSYVWELWRNGRSLELTDPTTGNPSSTSILSRFINIGFLCVQESSIDRPTMVDVVSFISNEYTPLPIPKPQAFCIDQNTTVVNVENCSRNNITISIMEAR